MKLTTFIFLFLICILFDLHYCSKHNKNKRGKSGKCPEQPKSATSLFCKEYCERSKIKGGFKEKKQTRIGNEIIESYLNEDSLKRVKRARRGEAKKNALKPMCCFCGGGGDEDKSFEEIMEEYASADAKKRLELLHDLTPEKIEKLKEFGILDKTHQSQTRDPEKIFQDDLARATELSLQDQGYPQHENQPIIFRGTF